MTDDLTARVSTDPGFGPFDLAPHVLILEHTYSPLTRHDGVKVTRGEQSAIAYARDIAQMRRDVERDGEIDFFGVTLDESDVVEIRNEARRYGIEVPS